MEVSMENDLSDNQRRFICRVVFLLVCALPTIAIVYFAAHQRTADQWAQLVQAELGVEASIGGVESPLPGQYIFRDVKLYDNNGKEFFNSLTATASLGERNQISFPTKVQVKREGMSHFLEDVAQRIIKPGAESKLWEAIFSNVEISEQQSEYEVGFHMNRLEARLLPGPQGPYVRLGTLLAGKSGTRSEDWGWLVLSKNPTTREFKVNLDTTRYAAVPCWLAKHWIPSLDTVLGSNSHFSGEATISSFASSATGEFSHINLSAIPGIDVTDIAAANSLNVNEFEYDYASGKRTGNAAIRLNDGYLLEIPNREFYSPSPRPNELFSEVIRQAFRNDSNAGLRR